MHFPPRDTRDEDLFIQLGMATQPTARVEDPLDDVFGSDSESPDLWRQNGQDGRESHPSDTRRLQSEHVTAGYREGITAAKEQSIQAGFDEGFSLGATIGLRAGQLLGMLEGTAGALQAVGGHVSLESSRLLEEARKELNTEGIFNEQYWAADGTWKFEVKGAGGGGEDDIVFEDVANGHPVIRKWNHIVQQEVERWELDRKILDLPGETPTDGGPGKKEVKVEQAGTREVLDW